MLSGSGSIAAQFPDFWRPFSQPVGNIEAPEGLRPDLWRNGGDLEAAARWCEEQAGSLCYIVLRTVEQSLRAIF
jgi:hypothetical protein